LTVPNIDSESLKLLIGIAMVLAAFLGVAARSRLVSELRNTHPDILKRNSEDRLRLRLAEMRNLGIRKITILATLSTLGAGLALVLLVALVVIDMVWANL